MMPFGNERPSFLVGVAVDDADEDGDATELESENQDNSKGNSGGPLWGVWGENKDPYILGVTSANEAVDYGPFGNDYQVLNASGKAMVDMVGLARLSRLTPTSTLVCRTSTLLAVELIRFRVERGSFGLTRKAPLLALARAGGTTTRAPSKPSQRVRRALGETQREFALRDASLASTPFPERPNRARL